MRKFGPRPKFKDEDIRFPCPACNKHFVEGDYTTLIALGPGDDEEERRKRDAGGFYNAVCVEVHWDCAKRDDENDLHE
jgi:hypothetical protein